MNAYTTFDATEKLTRADKTEILKIKRLILERFELSAQSDQQVSELDDIQNKLSGLFDGFVYESLTSQVQSLGDAEISRRLSNVFLFVNNPNY